MAVNNSYAKYQQNSINTASPEELTLMLYNGAIKFAKQGKIFMEQNDIEKANNSILRVQDIINELNITLNMDYEVSEGLKSLYTYFNERLTEANIQKSTEIIDEVLPLLEELRDTWKEAMKIAKIARKTAR